MNYQHYYAQIQYQQRIIHEQGRIPPEIEVLIAVQKYRMNQAIIKS
jgi:hypothetical protein